MRLLSSQTSQRCPLLPAAVLDVQRPLHPNWSHCFLLAGPWGPLDGPCGGVSLYDLPAPW